MGLHARAALAGVARAAGRVARTPEAWRIGGDACWCSASHAQAGTWFWSDRYMLTCIYRSRCEPSSVHIDIVLHETVLVLPQAWMRTSRTLVGHRYLGARALCARSPSVSGSMESKTSEPGEGENITYSHTQPGGPEPLLAVYVHVYADVRGHPCVSVSCVAVAPFGVGR